jgi:23S rRNA (uracil1939-C5)-methyltransferase
MTATEVATVYIDAIAAGGRGVGRLDGMAVFVPRAAPGDTLEVALTRRRRFAEGRIRRIVQPGPERVAPRCRHYERDRCGGCQLQHLDPAAQKDAKQRIISDTLTRIARRAATVAPIVHAGSPWSYRNKLTLAIRRRGQGWIAGLHRWDQPDEIFALEECPITDDGVLAGWREVMRHSALLPNAAALRGAVRQLGDRRSLVLEGGRRWDAGPAFAAACPGIDSIHWIDDDGRVHALREAPIPAAPAAFEQVNAPVSAALHAHVVALVRQGAPRRVIDAYAGRGITAAALVDGVAEMIAIELDPSAVHLARHALADRVRVIEGRVEDHLAAVLPADTVVLNPPRAGVDARVCAALERAAPRPLRIVYVSCDPATLARDLTRLPSWRIAGVQPFDMFPQTAHVETVCDLVLEQA